MISVFAWALIEALGMVSVPSSPWPDWVSSRANSSRHFGQQLPGALSGTSAPHSLQVRCADMTVSVGLAFTGYYSTNRERLHSFCTSDFSVPSATPSWRGSALRTFAALTASAALPVG